ncbi:MAG: DNA-binding protein [Planctomycetota bacterium]|nr:MAG: DNA-binding protein [Planctomycetota bacterium]
MPNHAAPLVTAEQAAAMCAVSLRTWRTWHSYGRVPRPVRIGRTLRWRRDELNAWIAAGCPKQREWDAARA